MKRRDSGRAEQLRRRLQELDAKPSPTTLPDFAPLPESEIARIEDFVSGEVPSTYRLILEHFGRVSFNTYHTSCEAVDRIPWEKHDNTVLVSLFWGLFEGENEVLDFNEIFEGRLPRSLITIGQDLTNREICLGVSGPERNKVYIWDRYDEQLTEENYKDEFGRPRPREVAFANVYRLADSLEEFLAKLQWVDDEDDEDDDDD